ncbi:MAG: acyltransferase [Wenzhouxiangella sp.]|nr:acyltransferase [Wenzhouxiangella sp.]
MSKSKDNGRDIYPDALRALALTVVVLGHWIATLPRMEDGYLVDTDHLLDIWPLAGLLTWLVQVVPLFVFVSAAVSTPGVERRWLARERQFHWWGGRALALTRPTVTYLAALSAFALISLFTGGRLLEPFNTSLTVHLWFLIMLLTVQALLPLSVAADRRFGLGAVFGLIGLAALVDLLRGQPGSVTDLLRLGELVTGSPGGIGWLNALLVWLLPQQLGIAWQKKRFRGAAMGLAIVILGALWLWGTTASGYPIGMVGRDFEGNSNMLPPTLALIGVMWLQVGLVLLLERPARALLATRLAARIVKIMGALGMPLYLWHKLAELPAAWVGERLGVPLDLGDPGEPTFWLGRLIWLGLCTLMVAPVMAAVVSFELTRKREVPTAQSRRMIVAGGVALMAGLIVSLGFGAMPGALIGLVGVVAASVLLRERAGKG